VLAARRIEFREWLMITEDGAICAPRFCHQLSPSYPLNGSHSIQLATIRLLDVGIKRLRQSEFALRWAAERSFGNYAMGARFTIDVSLRLVIVTFEGQSTVQEISDLFSQIRSHPDFDPDFSQIIDCTNVTQGNMPTDEIRSLARGKSIYKPTSLQVVVAPRDHIFALARMGQAYAEQTIPNLMVVRTMAEALKILKR
jgi:hypothetical protein